MTEDLIPAGYRKDAKGRLIHEKQIKPIDLARDELVGEIVSQAKAVQKFLQAFKTRTFEDIAAFIELSGEQYRVQLGGTAAPGVTPDRSKTFASGVETDHASADGSTPGAPPQLGHLQSVVALVWRSVLLWLLLLALLSLANLVG